MSAPIITSTVQASEDKPVPKPYEYGPVHLFGTDAGLFKRHLLYDNVIERTAADARDRFEAFARAVRDVLSQRWVSTESAYERLNPKRIYYLSMEFLIGRSLANNVVNLRLAVRSAVEHHGLDWTALLEEEPDAALGMAGWGGWLPASWIPWRRCSFRRWATDCATTTDCSSSLSRMAGSRSDRITGFAGRILGRWPGRRIRWKSN